MLGVEVLVYASLPSESRNFTMDPRFLFFLIFKSYQAACSLPVFTWRDVLSRNVSAYGNAGALGAP